MRHLNYPRSGANMCSFLVGTQWGAPYDEACSPLSRLRREDTLGGPVMRDRLRSWGCGAALLAGLALPAVAQAQPPRNGVYPVTINNGTRITVRYVLAKDATVSPGE